MGSIAPDDSFRRAAPTFKSEQLIGGRFPNAARALGDSSTVEQRTLTSLFVSCSILFAELFFFTPLSLCRKLGGPLLDLCCSEMTFKPFRPASIARSDTKACNIRQGQNMRHAVEHASSVGAALVGRFHS